MLQSLQLRVYGRRFLEPNGGMLREVSCLYERRWRSSKRAIHQSLDALGDRATPLTPSLSACGSGGSENNVSRIASEDEQALQAMDYTALCRTLEYKS
jgi:hypothetical protein